jgi:hypothetical protein
MLTSSFLIWRQWQSLGLITGLLAEPLSSSSLAWFLIEAVVLDLQGGNSMSALPRGILKRGATQSLAIRALVSRKTRMTERRYFNTYLS